MQAPQRASAADTPRQGRAHQLIVPLAGEAPERWEGMRRALGTEYPMREVGFFPLASIGV